MTPWRQPPRLSAHSSRAQSRRSKPGTNLGYAFSSIALQAITAFGACLTRSNANRRQKSLDVKAIGGCTSRIDDKVSRKTQPARSWSWLSGLHAFGTVLRRDSAPLWLLQVGTPSFGNNHCVKAT